MIQKRNAMTWDRTLGLIIIGGLFLWVVIHGFLKFGPAIAGKALSVILLMILGCYLAFRERP